MAHSTLFDLHSSDLHSEAEVETRLLAKLFDDLGYPHTAVIPKKQLSPLTYSEGSKKTTVEADFLLFGSNKAAKVVVEAKDPKKSVQDAWGQAAGYALSYNRDKADGERIKWLLISNGHITSLYRHDSDRPTITLQLSDFVSGSPPYTALKSYIKYKSVEELDVGELHFEQKTPEELNNLFSDAHQLIWKKEKMSPSDAFYEFCKFIFMKIKEDKRREQEGKRRRSYELPMTLEWLEVQRKSVKHPVRDILFVQLRDDLERAIARDRKRRIFETTETLKLGAETCRELIRMFQTINLSSIDDDLNGRMFEVFLNAAVRGRELGQYFTPRPLVDFMTRIAVDKWKENISDPPRVIDACCGTAGFLIEVMAYLQSSLRNDKRFTDSEREKIKDRIHTQCLFGVEGNERVSRIARINMYLHGDGGSHIFHGDGLDNNPPIPDDVTDEREKEIEDHQKEIKNSTFDIVLTNPPFSMSYAVENDDEERILRQLSIADGQATVKSNVLFFQRYYDLLKPNGEMLIVIDDTVLNGATQRDVRKWLLSKFVLLGVHSMPFNAFFKAKANIKTSVVHVRKKENPQEQQGHVFMSISNNIGHDNALRDTPERNNLTDILNTYFEWKRTGVFTPFTKPNQDRDENLECPEQAWLVEPEKITDERLDAFFFAPDLYATWRELERMEKDGMIELKGGKDFVQKKKLSKKEKKTLKDAGKKLRYVEISDVTRYGLITSYITGTIDELPTRGEYRIKKGDILMAINNSSRGTVVLVPKEFDGALCTSGFLVLEPRNEEEGLLLWYALRSEPCRKQIYYLSQTASQPELKMEGWEQYFKIPIPTGGMGKKAIADAKAFHSNISSLLNADSCRLVTAAA